MEPSRETFEAVGRLCVAWAYLEYMSEKTLWGILALDERQARAFVWRMALPEKWNAINREAKISLPDHDQETLKLISKSVTRCARDRNIVVHGLVHASILTPLPKPPAGTPVTGPVHFVDQPCWTIFKGDDAGKCFPISTPAVEIIMANVQKVSGEIEAFNAAHCYTKGTPRPSGAEANWPIPL